jgi:ribonucleoside-diphosphate reductase alpha chain
MEAVEADGYFELTNPQDGIVWEKVRARELFDLVVSHAHHNGEPGVLFIDTANRHNPVPHQYELEATNPCGEQWLGPYESCCLGSVNLARHLGENHTIDWARLQKTVASATTFLDDVIDANAYVPAVPQLQEAAHNARRIGLGIMGLADMMYHVGVRYGSEKAQEFASQVMEFVRYHCMMTSVDLAVERGAFPTIHGSIYDANIFSWTAPKPLVPHESDFGRPSVDWNLLIERIKRHGIRNAAQTTVAPTGTIATVAGCEGYGCEPVFALAYVRHVNDKGKDLELQYTSPVFEKALNEAGIDGKGKQKILDYVMEHGSCQGVLDLPEDIQHTFVVASDISPEEHVRMQAAIQRFVDNSISKTCNFPATATKEDVAKAYKLAWELGCKGLTVYVTGSREKVVLETNATKNNKEDAKQAPIWSETKKPRAGILRGETHRVMTPLGHTYVTINENGHNHPFEVFIQTSKAGSDTAAVSEAIGRLVSYILRISSQVHPRDRMKEVIVQLGGIGGGRPLGFGSNRVLSLPDGVAQALSDYLSESLESETSENGQSPQQAGSMLFGDLCPECGKASVVNEEGCRKCYSCGFSEC